MMLQRTHRQATGNPIPSIASQIRKGEIPVLCEWRDEKSGMYMINTEDESQGRTHVVSIFTETLPRLGFARGNIQMLTPRRVGITGTIELNKAVHTQANHHRGTKDAFATGDCVIQTVNNYDLGAMGIMNGQIGSVIEASDESIVIDSDGESVLVPDSNIDELELELAYVITVHKNKGSQYKAVTIPLYALAGRLPSRPLTYTAITQATDPTLIVGTPEMLSRGVHARASSNRVTAFPNHLTSAVADVKPRQSPLQLSLIP